MPNTPLTEETAKHLIEALGLTRNKMSDVIKATNGLNTNISEKISGLEKLITNKLKLWDYPIY